MSDLRGKYRVEGNRQDGWAIIRNHDAEIMALYRTRKDAEQALTESVQDERSKQEDGAK